MPALSLSDASIAAAIAAVTTAQLAGAGELGALRVHSEPAGARVYVEGFLAGSSPLQIDLVPEGTYRVVVTSDDRTGRAINVPVIGGAIAQVDEALLAGSPTFALRVRDEDDWIAILDRNKKRYEKAWSVRRLDDYRVLEIANFLMRSDESMPPDHLYAVLPDLARALEKKTRFDRIVTSYTYRSSPRFGPSGDSDAPTLVLSGVITRYQRGSRVKRWGLGWGAGKTRVYCLFRLVDKATGEVLLERMEHGSVDSGPFTFGGASADATKELGRAIAKALDRAWRRQPPPQPPSEATTDRLVLDDVEYLRGHPALTEEVGGTLAVDRSRIDFRSRRGELLFTLHAPGVDHVAATAEARLRARTADIGVAAVAAASAFVPFAYPIGFLFHRGERHLLSIESQSDPSASRQLILFDVHDHSALAAKKRIDQALGLDRAHYRTRAEAETGRRRQQEAAATPAGTWTATATVVAGDDTRARTLIAAGCYDVLLFDGYVALRRADGVGLGELYRLPIKRVDPSRVPEAGLAPVYEDDRLVGFRVDGQRYSLF